MAGPEEGVRMKSINASRSTETPILLEMTYDGRLEMRRCGESESTVFSPKTVR